MGFELICKRFNHSSPSVTMRYLGIEDKEGLKSLLMKSDWDIQNVSKCIKKDGKYTFNSLILLAV